MASRRGEGFDHAGHQRQQQRRSREDDGGQHVGILAVDHNHRVALEQARRRAFLRTILLKKSKVALKLFH